MPTGIYIRTKEHCLKIKQSRKYDDCAYWLGKKMENSANWQGGISFDRNRYNKIRKEKRHRLGISKKYCTERGNCISNTSEYRRLQRKKYKYLKKNAGELSIKTIQLVYEDNIKKYGTLTCYLCLLPIEFKKDSLEHKTPLSRGGTNAYENLAIAHISCNCKKRCKTEEEFRNIEKGKNIYDKV